MPDIPAILTQIAVLFFSLCVHESAHAWTANYLGDPTAKMLGRITLNPLKHIDPFGTILLPVALILMKSPVVFGWAKPVPVNPFNFRDRLKGMAWVSAAGPLSNLALTASGFVFLKFFFRVARLPQDNPLILIFLYMLIINSVLFLFNLIPLPPLDGASVITGFLSPKYGEFIDRLGPLSFLILLALLMTHIFDTVVQALISFLLSWI